ncbi:MAG: sugar transporter substrate-binding protein, partial [Spirosoma sp.]|nr:sugar transporter substrate-binding protein [Spirosoma sp.]
VVPTDNYIQKVGVAAGANQLPCLMSSDVVYMPNFISKNLFRDITDKVNALDFKDSLAKGLMDLGTSDGKIYSVPHTIGMSALFQNDLLLQKAGIDPSVEITSLTQLQKNAEKVAALGPDVSGLYYTGNNAGTIAFTHFPSIWASGAEALSKDGKQSMLSGDKATKVFSIYNDMVKSGATPQSVLNETGATRNQVFGTGKVGYLLGSNSVLQSVKETPDLKIGVQGIPGVDGGQSTFLGGDVLGISNSCQNADGAWNFLNWTLSPDAQVEVYAKSNQLTVRTDLAKNKYTENDPRIIKLNELIAKGRTPYSMNFGQTFNDPNGPALSAFRDALFGDNPAAALKSSDEAINASLSQ